VHSNSGVPNQAYALFVDGGVVNEVIVEGVGLIKGFNIYVRALGSHTSTTNFVQHAMLLTQVRNRINPGLSIDIKPGIFFRLAMSSLKTAQS
jgi:Zn-dependent metalloprotease